MQYVSSLGGPRVLLPTKDVDRWITELGDAPTPDEGLYGLACSVDGYCGIIQPWESPILIFGGDPADIFWIPNPGGGLFIWWLAADSLDQLISYAVSKAEVDDWEESVQWQAQYSNYTLMDTCTYTGDEEPRISITISPGEYIIQTKYASSVCVSTVVQELKYMG